MPRPVNLLTPDAPDNERPAKQPRPPKMGSGIKVLPMPADKRGKREKTTPMPVDDLDKDIYTVEKGKPPMADDGPTKNVKKYAAGGMANSASRRADGIAQKGKTKCRIV